MLRHSATSLWVNLAGLYDLTSESMTAAPQRTRELSAWPTKLSSKPNSIRQRNRSDNFQRRFPDIKQGSRIHNLQQEYELHLIKTDQREVEAGV